MRLIGIKIGSGDHRILKNLREDTWYPFGLYDEPTEANGWRWLADNQKEEEEGLSRQLYSSLADQKDASLDITVNCIVGKNGSGKSSLLDILYRIINNFSFRLFDQLWEDNDPQDNPQRGHVLIEAEKFDATLFFESDGSVGSIRYFYGKYEYNYHSGVEDSEMLRNKLEGKKISKTLLEKITRHFFYTIASNYSIHSMNANDYAPNSLWIEEDEDVNGDWLQGLFHKNDGYVTPIVMVPFRNKYGTIDIKNESDLAKTRLATLSVLSASQGRRFLDGYSPLKIVYRFRHTADSVYNAKFNELYRTSLPLNNQTSILKRNIKSTWRHALADRYKDMYKDLPKKVRESVLSYLAYKTLKTCLYYRKYGELLGIRSFTKEECVKAKIKGEIGFYLDFKRDSIKEIVNAILIEDASDHINLKIQQLIFTLTHRIYTFDNLTIPEDFPYDPTEEIKYGMSRKEVSSLYSKEVDGKWRRVPFKTYDEAFLRMPPAIFDWDISFSKQNGDTETLSQMSSGERQLMYSISYIIYHLTNLQSVKESGTYRVKYHNVCLIFDEAELYYHPDYQRTFISQLIKTLSWCNINKNIIRGVNILIVTHSPFVLSDVPVCNTLYLKEGKVDNTHQQTFAGNVHELLGDNFFIDYSIGEVAKDNIEEIIKLFNRKNDTKWHQLNREQYLKNKKRYKYISSILADDYLCKCIGSMIDSLDVKFSLEADVELLDRKIREVRKELQSLENKRRNLTIEENHD